MSRSRQLVSQRWGKTFGTFLVLGIIVIIASLIFGAITGPFGIAGTIVNGILSALYQPLFPILLAVYYYSNLARTATPPPPGQIPMGPTTTFQAGMKLCPTCGAQNPPQPASAQSAAPSSTDRGDISRWNRRTV